MATEQIKKVSAAVEEQSLNTVVAGFSFAAALAWMDVVRSIVSSVVSAQKNGIMNSTLTAIITTLLSVVIFLVVSRLSKRVVKPTPPVFAVTA
jgi:tetrahydromethanopterin S-methyltransferase subunit C